MEERALRFISERVEPLFDGERGFEKRPVCPSGFVWRERTYRIDECLLEWRDYGRRGKMAHNMRPPAHRHSREARVVGSRSSLLQSQYDRRARVRPLLRPRAEGHVGPEGELASQQRL